MTTNLLHLESLTFRPPSEVFIRRMKHDIRKEKTSCEWRRKQLPTRSHVELFSWHIRHLYRVFTRSSKRPANFQQTSSSII